MGRLSKKLSLMIKRCQGLNPLPQQHLPHVDAGDATTVEWERSHGKKQRASATVVGSRLPGTTDNCITAVSLCRQSR